MAITDVVVPQLSESVSEATLLTWKKKPGEAVTADEILIEVETDKVVLEVPAPVSGVFTEIVRADGSMVVAGEVIARIDTAGKAAAVTAAPATPEAVEVVPFRAVPLTTNALSTRAVTAPAAALIALSPTTADAVRDLTVLAATVAVAAFAPTLVLLTTT